MAGGAGYGERSLKETPTWAVALVCAMFVIISVIIEHGIHSLSQWFQKRQKKAMSEALEKIKSELMLLGFISLLITVGTKPISKICIPEKAANIMLPCKDGAKYDYEKDNYGKDNDRRKLLWYDGDAMWRRVLAPASGDDYFSKPGKVALISQSGVNQLHIFIFVLAVFHVLYSVVTIALAKAKVAFFRQFFASVTKVDYLTMRHGFINAHFAPNSKFNFHKYIKRSMEDDFKVVVGISIPLWTCSIVFQLLNVYGLYTLLWIQFIPLVMVLIVGAKLEIIIMEMAQHIQDKTSVVKGVPVVEPSNKYFWFNHPNIILFLIHFTLFQNSFQMAYFLWIWYEFGLKSCFHENLPEILTRVILGVALQFLCSYITFPLYALVTQMGSHMKKAIFEEQTAKALKKWQKAARERNKLRKTTATAEASTGFRSPDQISTPSRGTSPMHLLHKYKSNNSVDLESVLTSPRASNYSETELSETEGPSPSSTSRDGHEPRRETLLKKL
ncbi:hypothetical protein GH714_034938 [Hevea brasiliensis]|uniref:MLO-like protein n=1 Tax=Hevea brasiliensis TaxID=3981 RepID=A0A6A6MHV3_HEVBR|nr:hypothetical protein GH714_034938 [Hevea brasiliensis]